MPDRHDHDLMKTLRRLGSFEPDAASAARAVTRAQARLAAEQEENRQRFLSDWRSWLRGVLSPDGVRWRVGPAVALAGLLLLVCLWGSHGSRAVALADVIQALNSLQSISYTTSVDQGKGFVAESATRISARNLVRSDYADGHIYIFNRATGQSLTLRPEKKGAEIHYGMVAVDDLFDVVESLPHRGNVARTLPQQNVGGVQAVGFVLSGQSSEHVIWVEPRSRRLVRWEATIHDNSGTVTRHLYDNFDYDQVFDERLFDLTPPADYRIEQEGVPELAPVIDAELQSPTLFIGQGIGPARFGMSREEVVRVFGPPDEIVENLQSYRYASRGIELFISPQRGLWGIICRVQTVSLTRIRDYTGQTAEGIRMGATTDDIVAAYGPADARVSADSGETLSYQSLHIHFQFHRGKLVFIQQDASSLQ